MKRLGRVLSCFLPAVTLVLAGTGAAHATVPGPWQLHVDQMTVFILDITDPSWQDSGIDVLPDELYYILVQGVATTSTTTDPATWWLGPGGRTEYNFPPCTTCIFPGAPPLAVIGALRPPDGEPLPFYVGDGGNIYGDGTWNGRLLFAYNDFPDMFSDNWGYYVVKIIRWQRAGSGLGDGPGPTPGMPWLTTVPNPLVMAASITFSLPAAGPARVEVFDVGGRLIRTLLDGITPAGRRTLAWDGRDASGRTVPSGTYFCRVHSNGAQLAEKMVVTR